ncbi:MAG: hypothetical protein EXR36_10420 [Betaproteobacteria bacterium]|nr:hypothetical protein [Betaproteobacteria bacterium]
MMKAKDVIRMGRSRMRAASRAAAWEAAVTWHPEEGEADADADVQIGRIKAVVNTAQDAVKARAGEADVTTMGTKVLTFNVKVRSEVAAFRKALQEVPMKLMLGRDDNNRFVLTIDLFHE